MIHQMLLGAAGAFPADIIISANTLDFNVNTALSALGWDGQSPFKANIIVNAGVAVGASSTASYAFDTGTVFPSGSEINLINNGTISGRGGNGGGAGRSYGGDPGGPGLIARNAIGITNNGVIQGGGGGGGSRPDLGWGGGGGGAGYPGGTGGTGGGYDDGQGPNGRTGTLTAGGIGGYYYGGAGGSPGASGASSATMGPQPGGSGGLAITGNNKISWTTIGTTYGSIAA